MDWPQYATSAEAIINPWFDRDPMINYGIVGKLKVGAIMLACWGGGTGLSTVVSL